MFLTINNQKAPVIIADMSNYMSWRPHHPCSSKIVVEYMGNMAGLPRDISRGRKAGRMERKFSSQVDANKFEKKIIASLEKAQPTIVRDTRYSGIHIYARNDGSRAFSIEQKPEVYFDRMLKKMIKRDFGCVPFGPSRKAVFMCTWGGGQIHVLFDEQRHSFSIFKSLTEMSEEETFDIFSSSRKTISPFPVKFKGPLFIADSALDVFNFENIQGEHAREKSLFVQQALSNKEYFSLSYEGSIDGVAFQHPARKFTCFARHIQVHRIRK